MGKVLLSEAEFSRIVVSRVRQERPSIQVKAMGQFLLLVEPEPGRRRMVSLLDLYQLYCESPLARDEVIGNFLAARVYEEPAPVRGDFEANRAKIMPQVVPPTLIDFCRKDRRDLAAVEFIEGLAIAFVIDEPERYAYIHSAVAQRWGVSQTELLATAIQNLQGLSREDGSFYQIGTDTHLNLVWETFDGYDASRILLSRELGEMATRVAGNPVIGIPHRDYLVMFGDADPDFVTVMADRIREYFEGHSYPISPRLFTLVGGTIAHYAGPGRVHRLIN